VVNGVRLFFDVEGAKLVPDGPVMREKPTLLMLHGGPGADHSIYRPAYSALTETVIRGFIERRRAFSSESLPRTWIAGPGSRQENASNKKREPPFRFNRSGGFGKRGPPKNRRPKAPAANF
jgi:hypothetical protein